jgi:hypothetical protein
MAGEDFPNYILKLAIPEEVFGKAVSKILADFNVYMDEDKALKLVYALWVQLMHYLYTHPGQYFKLKYLDITMDKGSLLNIKPNADLSEGIVDVDMLYNKYCSEAMLQAELKETVQAFAQSFLDVREEKIKEVRKLDNVIRRRRQAQDEAKECTRIVHLSDKLKRQAEREKHKLEKMEKKQAKKEFEKKGVACFTTNLERHLREQRKNDFERLKAFLYEKWKENKNDIPFK